jgi:hypothetical protein
MRDSCHTMRCQQLQAVEVRLGWPWLSTGNIKARRQPKPGEMWWNGAMDGGAYQSVVGMHSGEAMHSKQWSQEVCC